MTEYDYRCTHGHDLCHAMYPGPECPYCEKEEAMAFNPTTLEFAEMALADHPELRNKVKQLAQLIQDAVDDFIDMADKMPENSDDY